MTFRNEIGEKEGLGGKAGEVEISVGGNVMAGYYRNPAASEAALRDGGATPVSSVFSTTTATSTSRVASRA